MWSMSRVTAVSTIVANVTVVVSLTIAVLSYTSQIAQTKRDAAIALASEFRSGDLLASQRRLAIELAKLGLGRFQGIAIERETIGDIVSNLVAASATPDEIRQDIITIVSYFDDVAICVNVGTCDESVIRTSLGETATRYACLLLPYTQKIAREQLLEGLGDELRSFVDYKKAC